MKNKCIHLLSLLLAALLQMAPLMRSILPAQGLAPSAWGFILKLGLGSAALLGFDAVSQASSISITPPVATNGVAYTGIITYTGGHSGAVTAMSISNYCMSTAQNMFAGLTIVYNGGNQALVSGTPTSIGNYAFAIKIYKSGCGSTSLTDTRTTSLSIVNSGGAAAAPSFTLTPQSVIAQVGSDVVLNGTAVGNPLPNYYWKQGITFIPGGTNNTLSLPAVQAANAGIYTLTASNASGSVLSAVYLTVCQTPGSNILALGYTNYFPAGNAVTMYTSMTNVATATNTYQWSYNATPLGASYATNILSLPATQVIPSKSGTYSMTFNSVVGANTIVPQQLYDSYWAFGYTPVFTNALPATTNVNSGATVTFNVALGGTLNVFNGLGGAGYYVTNAIPSVFWYQSNTLVAAQIYTNNPTSNTAYSNTFVNASLTLNNVTPANNGSYTVVATNFWGSITSSPSVLTVTASAVAPGIASPPAGVALLAGQSSALSVTATGTAPLAYQWRKNGANLTNGGVYAGTLTNLLALTAVTTNTSGNYTVVITNTAGAITSSVAPVTITAPPALTSSSGAGNVTFNSTTLTGLTYVVQTTTNLAPPNWISLLTNNTGLSGLINFQTNTVNGPKFYRLKF